MSAFLSSCTLQACAWTLFSTIGAAQSLWPHATPPPPGESAADPRLVFEEARARAGDQRRAHFPLDRERELYFDRDEAGALWARGLTYKASFDARGATYIPFLGSHAPRNFPVRFTLEQASAGGVPIDLVAAREAALEGAVVTLDRGSIDEVYELGLESIEQTFVVEERPASGELLLSIAVETELSAGEHEGDLEFSNELGAVRYGRASIRERDGTLTALETLLVDGRIEIRVPAARMATATFPLVIDPVVSTFAVDSSSFDDQYPDAAYDETNDRYLIAFLEIFSSTDLDVYSRVIDSAGGFVSSGYVDTTAEVWYAPSIANLGNVDNFIVVSVTGDLASATNRRIKGRITSAASFGYGPVFDISGTATDYNLYPDVGGDPYALSAPSFFCVGWQRRVGGVDQVVYRLVDGTGVPQGTDATVMQSSLGVKDVSVSISNNTQRWNIAWDRCPSSASDCDIFAARVRWDGLLETTAIPVSNVSLANYSPRVTPSNSANQFLVAWTKENGLTDRNVECALVSGTSVTARVDMTALEAVEVNERQFVSSADLADGQFYVGYSESYNGSGTDTDPYVASVVPLGGSLALAERHEDLAYTSAREEHVALCAKESGSTVSSKRLLALWSDDNFGGGQSDISGAFVDAPDGGAVVPYCFGDGSGTACPCVNSGIAGRGCANSLFSIGARLAAAGTASVSGDTLVMTVADTPGGPGLFFQGTNTVAAGGGTIFGDGLLCVGGTITRLAVKFPVGGVLTYPAAGDPDISVSGIVPLSGAVRTYQTWYRDAAPTFCSASAFNVTNGLTVTWLN